MARTTVTRITDDIDDSLNAEEVAFSYRGTDYTIDLGKRNRAAFDKAMKPYVEAARKASRSTKSRKASPSATACSTRDLVAVRRWAKHQGIEVSDRGRVAAAVLAQYDAAHG